MKHLISVLSFAVFSNSAVADTGMPYDPLDVDRALPNIGEVREVGVDYPFGGSAPHDPLAIDMALPDLDLRDSPALVASGGNTRSDVEIAVEKTEASPWANDYHFIAPAQ
jgi:hypothetical protein